MPTNTTVPTKHTLVQDTRMLSGLNVSATGASVAATKGVGTTMSTTSQLDTTAGRSPVAVRLSGHLWPGEGGSAREHMSRRGEDVEEGGGRGGGGHGAARVQGEAGKQHHGKSNGAHR